MSFDQFNTYLLKRSINLFQRILTDPRLLNSSLYQMVWSSNRMSFQCVRVQSAEVFFKAQILKVAIWKKFAQSLSRDFVWVEELNRSGLPSIVAVGWSSQGVFKWQTRQIGAEEGVVPCCKVFTLVFIYSSTPSISLFPFVSGSAGTCQAIVELKYWCRISKHGV